MENSRDVRLSRRIAHEGPVFRVEVDQVRLPNGSEVRLDIVRHPASVVLIPMPDAARVVLVRQYRYAIDRWLWELPAGSVEPGEEPDAAARRECHEEIGMLAETAERLGSFYPTPGYCDEEMIFYRLRGLEAASEPAPRDEDEIIEPCAFELTKVRRMVESGEIRDMKTALAITLL